MTAGRRCLLIAGADRSRAPPARAPTGVSHHSRLAPHLGSFDEASEIGHAQLLDRGGPKPTRRGATAVMSRHSNGVPAFGRVSFAFYFSHYHKLFGVSV